MKDNSYSWLSFWDQPHSIYVNARHLDAHCRDVADGIIGLLPPRPVRVLDYGCGEAVHHDRVAARTAELVLGDGAPTVQAHLAERFSNHPRIKVLSPAEVELLPAQSIDLIFANSMVQYITPTEFGALLAIWRRLLGAGGSVILADVVPPGIGLAADALALLRYARKRGFLLAAILGLLKTAVSPYRKARQKLGITRYSEPEFLKRLAINGFVAERLSNNIEHNPARMSFRAFRT
ncbi:MAG: class I SAM-dependent methyltransferase [Xanthobacteraceae bacterium]|nr:class I SAM-dependent methyltransferase [Xanthobacteraceae bacterium]